MRKQPALTDNRKTFAVKYRCAYCLAFNDIIVKDTHKSFAVSNLKPILHTCHRPQFKDTLQGIALPVSIREVT